MPCVICGAATRETKPLPAIPYRLSLLRVTAHFAPLSPFCLEHWQEYYLFRRYSYSAKADVLGLDEPHLMLAFWRKVAQRQPFTNVFNMPLYERRLAEIGELSPEVFRRGCDPFDSERGPLSPEAIDSYAGADPELCAMLHNLYDDQFRKHQAMVKRHAAYAEKYGALRKLPS